MKSQSLSFTNKIKTYDFFMSNMLISYIIYIYKYIIS